MVPVGVVIMQTAQIILGLMSPILVLACVFGFIHLISRCEAKQLARK